MSTSLTQRTLGWKFVQVGRRQFHHGVLRQSFLDSSSDTCVVSGGRNHARAPSPTPASWPKSNWPKSSIIKWTQGCAFLGHHPVHVEAQFEHQEWRTKKKKREILPPPPFRPPLHHPLSPSGPPPFRWRIRSPTPPPSGGTPGTLPRLFFCVFFLLIIVFLLNKTKCSCSLRLGQKTKTPMLAKVGEAKVGRSQSNKDGQSRSGQKSASTCSDFVGCTSKVIQDAVS